MLCCLPLDTFRYFKSTCCCISWKSKLCY